MRGNEKSIALFFHGFAVAIFFRQGRDERAGRFLPAAFDVCRDLKMDTTQSRGTLRSPAPVNALPAGARLQEFEVRSVIGEGGFGIVYLAYDTLLEREIAIKEYLPVSHARRMDDGRVVPSGERQRQTFEKGLRCFVSEARMLARFKHSALVEVLRFWEEQGTAYMVMPYYRGQPLSVRIQAGFRIRDSAGMEAFLAPLLDGLALLHAANCYHRDISTSNILMLEDGQPLLLDFGAARNILVDQSDVSTVILKPGFAPIEQYSEDNRIAPQGAWTDLYALSAVAYQLITGAMPTVSVARIVRDPLLPLAQIAPPGFSPTLLAAIDAGLHVSPGQRPQSVEAFLGLMHAGDPIVGPRMRAMEAVLPVAMEQTLPAAAGEAAARQETIQRGDGAFAGAGPAMECLPQEGGQMAQLVAPVSQKGEAAARPVSAAGSGAAPGPAAGSTMPLHGLWRRAALAGVSLILVAIIGLYGLNRPDKDPAVPEQGSAMPPSAQASAMEQPVTMPFSLAGRGRGVTGQTDSETAPVEAEMPEAGERHGGGTEENVQAAGDDLHSASLPGPVPTEVQTPVAAGGGEYGTTPAPDAQSGTQEASAEQQQGTVEVRVEPWGNVFVNDQLIGVAPPRVRFQAEPGQIEVVVRNETHPAKHFTLNIEAGRTYRIRHVFGND